MQYRRNRSRNLLKEDKESKKQYKINCYRKFSDDQKEKL